MTPLFANSGFIRAKERLVLKGGLWGRSVKLRVRYGVVRHPKAGVILVDTGYGPLPADPGPGLRLYNKVLRPELVAAQAPAEVLRQIGAEMADVQLIILTHFHADHLGGLSLFPNAQIMARRSVYENIKNRSKLSNPHHGVFTSLLPDNLGARMTDVATLPMCAAPLGLGEGHDLLADGSMLAIDLPGHAEGHFGICFPQLTTPLLYAVDVQWLHLACHEARLPGLPTTLIMDDKAAALRSSAKAAQFSAAGGDLVLCHAPELGRFDLGYGAP
ncbi:MAG: MBL fold metallo-hydrolase [Rhodobacteraceae bacterium]|nr:MBL fold metallo-hydrolase [Paracoccaceae bacterium]